jgi:hypothetical protein
VLGLTADERHLAENPLFARCAQLWPIVGGCNSSNIFAAMRSRWIQLGWLLLLRLGFNKNYSRVGDTAARRIHKRALCKSLRQTMAMQDAERCGPAGGSTQAASAKVIDARAWGAI